MLILRKKLISSTAKETLWKQYLGCHQGQFGPQATVNEYALVLEEYQMRCTDNKGKPMITDHALKIKFIEGLLPYLKQSIKPHINYDMSLEELVTVAEKHASTLKSNQPRPTTHQGPQKPWKRPQDKQWSAGKPMEFQKSSYQLPKKVQENAAKVANKKGGPGGTFGHFPNANKRDKTNYISFGEREKLKQEGKCYHCKRTGHMANVCPNRKVSTASQQIKDKPKQGRITSAYQQVNSDPSTSDKDTQSASLKVMRPPNETRKYLIPASQRITNAAEITVNGVRAQALLDPCTQNGDLISTTFCHLHKIPTEEMQQKPLETAIKGSRSTMLKKATVELDIQGHKETRTLYMANLKDWDVILGEPALNSLNAIFEIRDNKISIQPRFSQRYELEMITRKSNNNRIKVAALYMPATCESATEESEESESESDSPTELISYSE